MGNCWFCGNNAGLLRNSHKACEAANINGQQLIVSRAASAALAPDFNEATFQNEVAAIAERNWVGRDRVRTAMIYGWRNAVYTCLEDGILTQEEERRLYAFRNKLTLNYDNLDNYELALLNQGTRNRIVETWTLELTGDEPNTHLKELDDNLRNSKLSATERLDFLVTGWESAVKRTLRRGLPTLGEIANLMSYLEHFSLDVSDVNSHGTYSILVKAAVIREAAEGIVPQWFTAPDKLPLNLQKSEQLVWAFDDVDYYERKTKSWRRRFRVVTHEWDEFAHIDTGLLAVTNKNIYFHGLRTAFRTRFDNIVSFRQYSHGFGFVGDSQPSKPQSFRTGDGWFAYNLVANLAKL